MVGRKSVRAGSGPGSSYKAGGFPEDGIRLAAEKNQSEIGCTMRELAYLSSMDLHLVIACGMELHHER